MKILILINGWLTKISGGDFHILSVSRYWSKNHEINFITPRMGYKFGRWFFKKIGKVYVYKTILETRKIKSHFFLIFLYLLRALKVIFFKPREKYDVIISSSHFFYDVIPSIIFKLSSSSKLIVYIHGPPIFEPKTFWHVLLVLHNRLMLFLIKKFADRVFIVNPITKKILEVVGFNSKKLNLISNGINIDEIPKRKYKKKYEACFMGRLVKQKGVFDLIDIWELVVKEIPTAKLIILGDGPEEEAIKRMISERKLSKNIILCGYKKGRIKYRYLKQSKIFILPSYKESWGISIMEALACGLPVLVYNLPEYRQIYKGKIIKIKTFDIVEFSKKILKVLKDRKLYRKYSSFHRWVRNYNWKNIANSQLFMIKKTISG